MSPEVSPDPVLESLDAEQLLTALQRTAVDLGIQAGNLETVASDFQNAIEAGKIPDIGRTIYECRQTRSLSIEERRRLVKLAERFDQSGVVHISTAGLRRAMFFFTMLLACIIAGMGIVLSH
jgi:hypothetical protein